MITLTKFAKNAIVVSYYWKEYMKIALIGSKGIPTRSGGVERHVEELATRFASLGHKVTVYGRKSYGLPQKSFFKDVRVLGFPSIATKNLDAITSTFLATMHILFHSYDIVHYHGIGPSSLLWIIRFFKPRTKVIATFHSLDYFHEKWGGFAKLYFHIGEWVTCTFPHLTITISQSLREYVRKNHKRSSVYIPNGCSVEPVSSQEILNDLEVKPKKYILTVSRIVRHKGIHFLIEAFLNIQKRRKDLQDWKLVIVGGSSHTDEYVEELSRLSYKEDSIILAGERSGKELQELFSHAYIFVQPSLFEGLSIALLEAMGYGIAPLVSDIPENREAVDTAGFIFESGNKESLEKSLEKIIDEPDEVMYKGLLSQKRAQEEYHWDTISKKTLSVYKNILHKKERYQEKNMFVRRWI